ncbi:hypothetical protein QFZ34_003068 [Phyllobacterium ifriqiyense]|uniref:DUF768 domain-containing protein n=1 Tax=Phyllobacterium ifriqiyense TaxID=314238 RepID=A0ABU0SB51_9HYPH|nr:hypothetical protein [Phyllobacterium ifriqiyense]MDQ0997886.1 hypothetical protein [Phyllobacterium ifriqiyense]
MITLGPALAFVKTWTAQNVHLDKLGDAEKRGEELARALLADAKAAGYNEAEIEEAVGDDVVDYMIEALGKAGDPKVGGS